MGVVLCLGLVSMLEERLCTRPNEREPQMVEHSVQVEVCSDYVCPCIYQEEPMVERLQQVYGDGV